MADSSKDIQLRELKDMINDLKKMIKTLQATVDAGNKREEALTQERDNLKEEIDLLRKKLFGTSSEKRTLDIPGQLNFFNSPISYSKVDVSFVNSVISVAAS